MSGHRLSFIGRCFTPLAFAAGALMLSLSQPPIGIWLLAWVALVPFILVCQPQAKPLPLAVSAYLVGFVYWLINIYWMGYVTVIGWIAFCAYTALLWPLLVLSLRWCRARRIPLTLAVPVLFVGAEQMQGLFLGGFYWHYLAHSQYANTTIVQIADIFGTAGVSFLIAMVNGLFAEFIIYNLEFRIQNSEFSILSSKRRIALQLVAVVAVIAGAIIYGRFRINQSAQCVTQGPLVGAVQTNVPQSVKQSFAADEEIFEVLLNESQECVKAGAEFVAWPETMVQAILDSGVLRLLEEPHSYLDFDKRISSHAKDSAYILAGCYGGTPKIGDDFDIRLAEKFNSAVLYKPDGRQSGLQYNKIHLVPFGEYLPFEKVPLVHNLFVKMSPYDYDYTLDAGSEYTVFEMQPGGQKTYRFSVMICYEDVVPAMARRFALDQAGRKRLDWLVNISNDGWFVRFEEGKVRPGTELAQHTAVCTFRAIENRLAILRSVNTGVSCLIDSLGRIRDGFAGGNLPPKAMLRQGMAGWFADKVPIDNRTTFFSRYGQWLDFCCEAAFIFVIIVQFVQCVAPPVAKTRSKTGSR